MKRIFYYALPLSGKLFKGYVHSLAQLSALFQIWCRSFGIKEDASLAMFYAGYDKDSSEKEITLALETFGKLPPTLDFIDLTSVQ